MSTEPSIELNSLHWHMKLLETLDVGLVVVDTQFRICLWNSFMENHSGQASTQAIDHSVFDCFPNIPKAWFQKKIESVIRLNNRAYINWEQHPHIFPFKSYRPITGESEMMYQNVTIIPLTARNGVVSHVGIMVYDVTDTAVSKLALETLNKQLETYSRTDALTSLYNRGYWEECMNTEYQRFLRTGQHITLVMLDIDHFKRVNDTYGHPAGDEVIRILAQTIQEQIRVTDIAGRYGGEEFGILLIDTDERGTQVLCERLRAAVEALTVHHEGQAIRFTISLGATPLSKTVASTDTWLINADKALYSSKEDGRNRVTISNN